MQPIWRQEVWEACAACVKLVFFRATSDKDSFKILKKIIIFLSSNGLLERNSFPRMKKAPWLLMDYFQGWPTSTTCVTSGIGQLLYVATKTWALCKGMVVQLGVGRGREKGGLQPLAEWSQWGQDAANAGRGGVRCYHQQPNPSLP